MRLMVRAAHAAAAAECAAMAAGMSSVKLPLTLGANVGCPRLPRGIGIERLRDPPTEWSRQFEALGLNPE